MLSYLSRMPTRPGKFGQTGELGQNGRECLVMKGATHLCRKERPKKRVYIDRFSWHR